MVGAGATRRLVAVNRAAAAVGAKVGQTVADARAMAPALRLFPADPAADRALLADLALACLCYTPWSAVDDSVAVDAGPGTGGLWLDISGCAHLLGGERPLLRDLLRRLRRYGLAARAAVADTPGAAWAWARFGDPAKPCLASGDFASLAALPAAALRLSPDTVAGLGRLGLKTVGDIAGLPPAGLTARFGDGPVRRLAGMRGRVEEPVSPCRPVAQPRSCLRFTEPIALAGDVEAAARQLLADLCRDLGIRRLGVRRLDLMAVRVDGTRRHVVVGTGRPNRDPAHLWRLLAGPLGDLDAGFGIDMVCLSAPETGPLAAHQGTLDPGGADGPGVSHPSVDSLCDALGNRLGFDRMWRFAPRQSHLPERAVLRLSPGREGPQGVRDTKGGGAPDAGPWDSRRPLRLFHRPEAVEAVAPLPDSPPLLFRWRRQIHRIVHAEGPERIGAEWWRRDEADRDYYCVEDEAGRRFWLFREGAYDGRTLPRWFLHGIFP